MLQKDDLQTEHNQHTADENYLGSQIQEFNRWKDRIEQVINEVQARLTDWGLDNPDTQQRLRENIERLRNDRLTLAFVAEFSRGKTELINAIFFSDYKCRLLPSEPGRTTMCPSEMYYDEKENRAFLRLLPIETRKEDITISEYKQIPNRWMEYGLNTESAQQMSQVLQEIIQTKRVSIDEAKQLGLYHEGDDEQNAQAHHNNEIEIPKWRHALISFPHPLLKQGLTILDTPGLNALGTEPELTVSMLPNAQAVLFVLGADTGVTSSDMDMWRNHVKSFHEQRDNGVVVALNKIDTLWDELKDVETIKKSVLSQRESVAQTLHIPQQLIFPISAQKALLGRVKSDLELLKRSGIEKLEAFLADQVLPDRESVLRDDVINDVNQLLEDSHKILSTRLQQAQNQLNELTSLRGKNMDVIEHLMAKTTQEQSEYLRNVESFQTSRKILNQQAKQMLDTLNMEELEEIIEQGRTEMEGSWTTMGLKTSMKTIFEAMQGRMVQALDQGDQTHTLIKAVYRKFHEEHGLPNLTPQVFSITKYESALNKLVKDAEAFRNSPIMAIASQSYVTHKFFLSFVEHAKAIFRQANREARAWLKQVLNPLLQEIKQHKHHMERRLDTLRKVNASRDTLEQKLQELSSECTFIQEQFEQLSHFHALLEAPTLRRGTDPHVQPLATA